MKTVLFLLALTMTLGCFSQSKKSRLYAYLQSTSAGVRPAEVDMEGNVKTGGRSGPSYMIYLQTPRGKTVTVRELWINGQAYSVKADTASTPVMPNSGIRGMEEKALVPATEDLVLRLIPGDRIDITSKAKRRYASGKPVVAYFSFGRKNCRRSVDMVVTIPPRVME